MDSKPKEKYDWLTKMVIDTERLENPQIGPAKASKSSKRIFEWLVFTPFIILLLVIVVNGIVGISTCGYDYNPRENCEFFSEGTYLIGAIAFMFLIPSLLFAGFMLWLFKLTEKK